jgi:hypothetical protein
MNLGTPSEPDFTVSLAPSPIDRTRNASISPRHASSGVPGSWPAAINRRHIASTGAAAFTTWPAATHVSSPISFARIGETVAGRSRIWRLPRVACAFGNGAGEVNGDLVAMCEHCDSERQWTLALDRWVHIAPAKQREVANRQGHAFRREAVCGICFHVTDFPAAQLLWRPFF